MNCPLFNHCQKCGKRIPWRKRAFFGNAYKPVVCHEHSYRSDPATLFSAAAGLIAEHPELAKRARWGDL